MIYQNMKKMVWDFDYREQIPYLDIMVRPQWRFRFLEMAAIVAVSKHVQETLIQPWQKKNSMISKIIKRVTVL